MSVVEIVFRYQLVVVFFEYSGILLIVMYVKNIGNYVKVSACIYTWAGRIGKLSLLVYYANKSVILSAEVGVMAIPGFIKGTPTDNGGVVEISSYRA